MVCKLNRYLYGLNQALGA
jgi:hypothetical protein